MKRSKLWLNPVTEFLVYLAFGLLLATGAIWMWAQTSLDEGNQVSSFMLKLHGAAAMAALILLGALITHVRKGLRARKSRSSGITLLLVILFLVVTGYGLYYAGDEQLRSLISRWHAWIGLGISLLLPAHVMIGRALRGKRSKRGQPAERSTAQVGGPVK